VAPPQVRSRWIAIARGDEPADLVLKGGAALSVFTGEVFEADIAIADGRIVGVGDYAADETVDVSGKYLIPGFLDGHCHIESSKLSVDEFVRAILPRGTTSVVVDPHELANVLGIEGIKYVLDAGRHVPMSIYVMLPSCVPASPYESPAAPLEAPELAPLLFEPRVLGVAEMMNYPGAVAGEKALLGKMALTGFSHIDGHAPGLRGRDLNAYMMAGPSSDHECSDLAEAIEKRRLGMWIMIREASMIRNLVDLLPMIERFGTDNCMFVTDDREASTLLGEGHINSMVRTAVEHGLPAADAVKLATLNVARYHGLDDVGAIAPGYLADILVLPDLVHFEPEAVYRGGRIVARHGKALPFSGTLLPESVRDTVHLGPVSAGTFTIPAENPRRIRVIELIPDQVVTRAAVDTPMVRNGRIVADPGRDLAKLAVVERHQASGRAGIGFVRGFGLQRGAFASTVGHDAHNVVVTGVDDEDMACCVRRMGDIGGGLVICDGGRVVDELPLEIAGLMSTRSAAEVVDALERLEARLREMGVSLPTPFMYLSFLALSVIPELRVTDQGIVDVTRFQLVPLAVS
jgi:adenine deaminase